MTMDDELQIGDGAEPNAQQNDADRLEAMIAADEAADAAQSKVVTRGEDGKFKSASAKAAPRAGERLTPEQISAAKPEGDAGSSDGQPKTETPGEQQPESKVQTDDSSKGNEAEAEAGKSNYRKEVERRERSWQELNRQKEELKRERDEFDLQRQTVTEREKALRRVPQRNGYTADAYEAAAPKFEAKARELEMAGDFEKADEQRQLAESAKVTAAELRKQAPGAGLTSDEAWKRLKTDLPEALNVTSPLNRELRALIQTRPDLLADEAGPYRVAVLAGRKLVAGLEQELARHQGESRKVPELTKQVETLTARVRELEGKTSPAGDGGGGAANRGNGRGRDFNAMTTAEQEAHIERELAGVL